MERKITIFRLMAGKFIVGMMLVLLALGARAQLVIGGSLNLQAQGPVHEEEEEGRGEGKAKASVRREDVPAPERVVVGTLVDGVRLELRVDVPVGVERESDHWNGLGVPLRC